MVSIFDELVDGGVMWLNPIQVRLFLPFKDPWVFRDPTPLWSQEPFKLAQ